MIIPITTFTPVGEKDPSPEMDIYLISNEIHVGVVVPLSNKVFNWEPFIINEYFSDLAQEMQWVEFGWGDRRFYFEMPTWDHFTLGLAADALFLPDPAVMHVGLILPPSSSSNVRRVRISFKTYEMMVKVIQSWFVLKNGKPILIPGKGYSPLDNFFEAHGSYSIIKTCNTWTSDIFAESGLRHPLWSPTKYGLEYIWNE